MLVKVPHPIYTISPGLEEGTILAGGGGGRGKTGVLNSIIKLKLEDKKLIIKSSFKYKDSISAIATYKNGRKKLIAIAEGPRLKLLNYKFEEQKVYDTEAKKPIFRNLVFSKDGKLLLCIDSDDALHLLKIPNFQLITKTNPDTYRKANFFYSEKEIYIVAATDENIKLISPDKELRIISTSEKFDFLPKQILSDEKRIIYIGNISQKKSCLAEIIYDQGKLTTVKLINPTKGIITAATNTPTSIAAGTNDGDIYILNNTNYQVVKINQKRHEWAISSASQIGNCVVTGGLDSLIVLTSTSKKPVSSILKLALIILIVAAVIGIYFKI